MKTKTSTFIGYIMMILTFVLSILSYYDFRSERNAMLTAITAFLLTFLIVDFLFICYFGRNKPRLYYISSSMLTCMWVLVQYFTEKTRLTLTIILLLIIILSAGYGLWKTQKISFNN